MLSRASLAILGQIGFEQIALRLGLAVERTQRHVLITGRSGLALELIEVGAQGFKPRARDLGLAFERAHELFAFGTDLAIKVGDLGPHLLDAGMLRQHRRGLLGELRPQRHALLGEPADQLGICEIGRIERLPCPQGVPDQARARLGVGLLRTSSGNLAAQFGELLIDQTGVVAADEQIGLGPVSFDLGLGLRHLAAQFLKLARQPLAGGACWNDRYFSAITLAPRAASSPPAV